MALAIATDLQSLLRDSGHAEFISLKDMALDPRYQPERRHVTAGVRVLAHRWNQQLAGSGIASLRRDGRYWLIDGGRRKGAAELRNQLIEEGVIERAPTIPGFYCIVHQGLSLAQEAQMFAEINGPNRVKVHPVEHFIASLLYDPSAKQLRDTLARFGLKVAYSPTGTDISSVGVLQELAAWGVLDATLEIITTAWPDSPDAHKFNVLLAVGAFDYTYREHGYDRGDLAALLFDQNPMQMVRDALDGVVDPRSFEGKSDWAKLAALMREEYNAGLPRGEELPPFVQPKRPRQPGLGLPVEQKRSA